MDAAVVVVGAGFAGLAAASEIRDRGVEVVVVEARTRVGGRVWSARLDNDEIVEMGAEWISPDERELIAVAHRVGLELADVGVDFMTRTVVGGEPVGAAAQAETVAAAATAISALDEPEVARSTLGSFIDRLNVTAAQRAVFRTRLQGSFGMDLDRVALRMLLARGSPLRHHAGHADEPAYLRLARGNQELAVRMAARVGDVRMSHRVGAIRTVQDRYEITGADGDRGFRVECAGWWSQYPSRPSA